MNKRYANTAQKLAKTSTFFPNRHQVAAELRPHSQTVHLHQIRASDIATLHDEKQYAELSSKIGTITHELTHWLDLVATVWGQEYLVDLFDAYEAAFHHRDEGPEYQWWKLIRLVDRDRRTMGLSYYKVINTGDRDHSIRNPWGLAFSVGREFDASGRVNDTAPIFFARFLHASTRELIGRVPLSVGALLEVRAVHFEKLDEFTTLSLMADQEACKFERIMRGRDWERTFYDPELLDYTVAAHVLSARSGTREPITTYRLAAELASVCLNLTSRHFASIRVPAQLNFIGPAMAESFLRAENRGFAFACLAFADPPYRDDAEDDTWLEEKLAAVGLPDRATLGTAAAERLEEIWTGLTVRWDVDRTRDHLLKVGREALPERLRQGTAGAPAGLAKAGIRFPPMFDSEGDAFSMFRSQIEASLYDPHRMFNLEADLWNFTDNFITACRGSSLAIR